MQSTTTYSVENNRLKTVITQVETRVLESFLTLDALYEQKANILQQREAQIAQKDNEIKEVNDRIAECIKRGLKTDKQLALEKAQREVQQEASTIVDDTTTAE